MDKKTIISILVLVILLIGAGWLILGRDKPESDSSGESKDQNMALSDEYRNKQARVKTNYGTFVIDFFDNHAPKAVENFVRLSLEGKYNGSPFHRVISSFMIQGGDYTRGDGTGGQSIWGTPFEDELGESDSEFPGGYKRGVVAMANAGPNTNSSQFFIMHADYPLPHLYTIFGEVIEGMEVLDKIAAVPVLENAFGEKSVPTKNVIIEEVTIESK